MPTTATPTTDCDPRLRRGKDVLTMSASAAQRQPEATPIELTIGGMTCASCAMRVEKKLNKLDGVSATVNYATEKARVDAPAGTDVAALIAEVEKTGYSAALPPAEDAEAGRAEAGEEEPDAELISLRQRLIGSVVLSVPIIAMAMIPALQ